MNRLVLLLLSVLASSATAFTPSSFSRLSLVAPSPAAFTTASPPQSLLKASVDSSDRETRINNGNNKQVGSFEFPSSLEDLQGLLDKLQNIDIDWSRLSESSMGVKENVMDGEFGQRGEVFFVAQFVCLLAILGGTIPVIGGVVLLLLGPGLLLSGLAVAVLSVVDMGSALSPWPKPPSGQSLITNGLYQQCRHPMYAGLLAACAGLAVTTDSVPRLALTVVLYLIFEAKTNLEESELAKAFPSEYPAYKSQVTSKFVPLAVSELLGKVKSN